MGAISTTTETDIDAIVRNNIRLSIDLWTWCARRENPAGLCLVRGDLRRRARGLSRPFRRRLPGPASAAQCLWVEQGLVRPLGPARGRDRRSVSAALGRPQILQRLWAERIPQGRPALRRRSIACADPRNPAAFVCSVPRIPIIPTAANCAILSGSATVSASRCGRCRNRARNPAFTTSVPGQRDPSWTRRKSCSRKWALRRSVEFIDLPAALRGKYQYYTCGSIDKLRSAGYARPFDPP